MMNAHDGLCQLPDVDAAAFFHTYNVTTFAVDPSETMIAFGANLSGKYSVWGMDLHGPAYPYPLSTTEQKPKYICFDPLGRYILVGMDTDGDEKVQLFLLPSAGGRPLPVREHPERRHFFTAISGDGERIYYASDKDNHRFLNSYVFDIQTGKEQTIHVGIDTVDELIQVAPNETSFVILKHLSHTHRVAYVVRDKSYHCLTPDENDGHVVYQAAYLNESIVFTTNYKSDTQYLASYDLNSNTFHPLFAADGEDFVALAVHPGTSTIYVLARSGVEDHLYAYEASSGCHQRIPLPVPVVDQLIVSAAETLFIVGGSERSPSNLFRRKVGGNWEPLTANRVMGVPQGDLVQAQSLRFTARDGLELEGLWFEARSEIANGWTVVWPHGGPQSAVRRSFRPLLQWLCLRGYHVWAPNFRGSSGYGAAFLKMVERDWGGGPRLDILDSIEFLVKAGRARKGRLFCVGGSYGGYMTLLLHGLHADLFSGFVDMFGEVNLFTFLESVPDHWKPRMEAWLGHPERDRDKLIADSPITYVHQMTKPMLVIQGANDPRVTKAESEQLVNALRANGSHVEYIEFGNEGHGFSRKENEIEAYQRIVEFLDRIREKENTVAIGQSSQGGHWNRK